MLFNSMLFLTFLLIVFTLYWSIPIKSRWVVLLVSSYYFYMSWNAKYVVLILITTVISYICARLLEKAMTPRIKKIYIAITLLIGFGILFVFKYFNFFMQTLDNVLSQFSIQLHPVTLQLLLPVGISFYTFQTVSYVIDVYRGKIDAEKNFFRYATFISFFPQLVAGPIERSENLLPQINKTHVFDYQLASYGIKLMAWGFFKKVIIADTLAYYVDKIWDNLYEHSGATLLIAVFFFSIQIYCDFSGYSDIAIGVAKLFGINLMTNFKSPYFSTSLKQFWNRWHISLSSWFRDYLYIPLGGNRCGKFRSNLNVLITFVVSGLWHGANMTFIVWGALHGGAQTACNLLFTKKRTKLHSSRVLKAFQCLIVFTFCTFAWIVFRSQNMGEVAYILNNMFVGLSTPFEYLTSGLSVMGLQFFELAVTIVFPLIILFAYDLVNYKNDPIIIISKAPTALRYCVYILTVFLFFILLPSFSGNQFIYFQF